MGIIAKHIGKQIGTPPTRVLTDISFEIKDGEFVSLTGRSGSGKSTLLYLLSTLDNPTEGSIEISGHDLHNMDDEELYKFRNQQMGFVFQFHYLIAELSALENVLMPSMKFKLQDQRRDLAESLLSQFGLKDKMHRLPRQLSGGEQQRVAVARALINNPSVVFADEPSGNLDSANARELHKLFFHLRDTLSQTFVIATHNEELAEMADRKITMKDGLILF